MTDKPSYEIARDRLTEAMNVHAITIVSEFVPFSRSRNAKPHARLNDRTLNWRVTVQVRGRDVVTTDYSAGIAHCPVYKKHKSGTLLFSVANEQAFIHETEKGTEYQTEWRASKPILPDAVDVLSALVMDADVLNYARFEDWANEFGYDTDSCKGEQVYRDCLAHALALRAALGDRLLSELQQHAHDL